MTYGMMGSRRKSRAGLGTLTLAVLLLLLLVSLSSCPVCDAASSMAMYNMQSSHPIGGADNGRRKLVEEKASEQREAGDKKDAGKEKKDKAESTARKAKEAKDATAKKKTSTAATTAVTDDAKKKDGKAKAKAKEPQFSVHKKPISAESLTKVAESVQKQAVAAAAAAAKKKTKVTKGEEEEKNKKKNAAADVTKGTDEKKKKDEKEKAETDETKKKVEEATKTGATDVKKIESDKAKGAAPKVDDKKNNHHDDSTANKNKAGKEPPKIPDTPPAIPAVSDADKGKATTGVKPMPTVTKPKTPKEVDKYKDMLKKTRDALLDKNPKLQTKLDQATAKDKERRDDAGAKKKKDEEDGDDVSGKAKLEQMTKDMKKKQALTKLRDMLRKQKDTKGATDLAELRKKKKKENRDNSKVHQRRSRPLLPGERVFNKVPIVKRAYKKTPLEEAYSDATLSLVEGLKHGIFPDDSNALDYRRKEALKDWLQLLSVTLPPELELHVLIDDLRTNLDSISGGKSKFLKTIKKHPIKEKKWSRSCNKSRRRSVQGFACGFWKLLHIVSVGLAEHRGGIDHGLSIGSTASYPTMESAISPMKAADILREYMALFFGCDVCSRNFLGRYDECDYHRCDRLAENAIDLTDDQWREFALYIWEVHNGISVGLFHDKVERKKEGGHTDYSHEDEIAVIWPNMEQCFQCLRDDGTFSEDRVYGYLSETYWSGPEKDSNDDILREYERALERPLFSNGILYVSLSLMLIGAWIMKKRYIKHTGLHKKNDDPYSAKPKQWRRI